MRMDSRQTRDLIFSTLLALIGAGATYINNSLNSDLAKIDERLLKLEQSVDGNTRQLQGLYAVDGRENSIKRVRERLDAIEQEHPNQINRLENRLSEALSAKCKEIAFVGRMSLSYDADFVTEGARKIMHSLSEGSKNDVEIFRFFEFGSMCKQNYLFVTRSATLAKPYEGAGRNLATELNADAFDASTLEPIWKEPYERP